MKKIILSAGMLVAIATAAFAQTNTTTIVQTDGARNDIKSTQTGQNLTATFNQSGATTTDNKAEVVQTGKGNTASITEKGKNNDVFIEQLSSVASNDKATVNISGGDSERNKVMVSQLGKLSEATILISGDDNVVGFSQGGDKNKAVLDLSQTGQNDQNTISVGQLGNRNQASMAVTGDRNRVTINQAGNDNQIGTAPVVPGATLSANAAAAGPVVQVVNPNTGITPATPPAIIAIGPATVFALNGINIGGDNNIVTVTQGAGTQNNRVAIGIEGPGADGNIATVNQLDNATDNIAVIRVAPGRDRNTATINQTGNAQGNEAGIDQQGDDDVTTITQTGIGNNALIIQKVTTTIGANVAVINQPGSDNNAIITQESTRASSATITQTESMATAIIQQVGVGGHIANITQNTMVDGARLIIRQEGFQNTANLTQSQIGNDFYTIPDLEVLQRGNNNIIDGTVNASNVINRITQTGNNNLYF